MCPGLGIIRLRFNGYNLSLKVRHPFVNCGHKGNAFSQYVVKNEEIILNFAYFCNLL